MERALNVLIIGPSQNGKSTFINRLLSMATNQVAFADEGDGSFKCTSVCTVYDIEIPLTDYKLFNLKDGKDYDVPSLENEEMILGGGWWKKQTKSKFAIRPMIPDGPHIRLRLIDTPGLDDSEGKDYENLKEVLGTLNGMAKSPVKSEREISAIALVYNSNGSFSYSFQKTLKDYERCMPNLFGGLAVINTNFSVTTWAQKRQHFLSERLLEERETVRNRLIQERRTEFAKLLARNPTHFFIDSKPKGSYMFDELVSRNTISEILYFWANSTPMKIGQMRLVKNENMKAVDRRVQTYLNFAIGQWNVERQEVLKFVSKEEALRSLLEEQHQELSNSITRIESDLGRYDNDSEYTIEKYTTSDEASTLTRLAKWAFREKIKNVFHIKEPNYPEFKVDAQDGIYDRWVSQSFSYANKSWTGHYEAKPGRLPRLTARSYTTNRVYHRETISTLRAELRAVQASLAKNEEIQAIHSGPEGTDQNPQLRRLIGLITETKDLIEILGQDSPPLDISFDEAARKRYQKEPSKVDRNDVFELVKAVKPDLEEAVRSVVIY